MDKNSDYRMFSNLSDIQLKVNGYKHSLINEAHGNHKPKTYKKYTRKKGKGIWTQHDRKSSTYKRERNREELQTQSENYKMAITRLSFLAQCMLSSACKWKLLSIEEKLEITKHLESKKRTCDICWATNIKKST